MNETAHLIRVNNETTPLLRQFNSFNKIPDFMNLFKLQSKMMILFTNTYFTVYHSRTSSVTSLFTVQTRLFILKSGLRTSMTNIPSSLKSFHIVVFTPHITFSLITNLKKLTHCTCIVLSFYEKKY